MFRMRNLPRRAAVAAVIAAVALGGVLFARAEDKVIPSETCRGLWLVPVSFGDEPEKTLTLVLDTGASHTSVDPDAYQRVTGRRVRAGKSA